MESNFFDDDDGNNGTNTNKQNYNFRRSSLTTQDLSQIGKGLFLKYTAHY